MTNGTPIDTVTYALLADAAYQGLGPLATPPGDDSSKYNLPEGWTQLNVNTTNIQFDGTSQSWAAAQGLDPNLGGFSATVYVNNSSF